MSTPTKNPYELAVAGLSHQELIDTLCGSLYPGARATSVALVLGYCKASRLDPMKKPVHIVPMMVATGDEDRYGNPIKAKRDVIMPGVGLYRTEAQKTGEYVGLEEPEFGPDVVMEYDDEEWVDTGEKKPGSNETRRAKKVVRKTLVYPQWCRITVLRLVQGEVRRFTAKEFWIENYATKGRGDAPNEMWRKRVYGQLAKCAEAQALRKGFPDTSGEAPTFEEMEGKTGADLPPVDEVGKDDKKNEKKPAWSDDLFAKRLEKVKLAFKLGEVTDAEVVINTLLTKGELSEEQKKAIRDCAITDVSAKGDAPAQTAADKADADGVIEDAVIKPAADAPKVTYAVLVDRVIKTKDTDELDDVMSLAATLPRDQREELFAKIDQRRDELLG